MLVNVSRIKATAIGRFWRAHDRDRQADQQTDGRRYSVCNNRP